MANAMSLSHAQVRALTKFLEHALEHVSLDTLTEAIGLEEAYRVARLYTRLQERKDKE
jgi:hypothetical protein